MPHRILTLQQAAKRIRIPERELFHLVQREEIPYLRRGEEVVFEHRQLDEWAQRRIMGLPNKSLVAKHREAIAERTQLATEDALVERLFKPEWITPALESRTKSAVLHDMAGLALTTGLLYDETALLRELEARESVASTAIGGGAAFLHARYHDPYLCSESFIVLGKTVQQIFFGAQDGEETDLFFLICCTDDTFHLHTLARLCLLAHGSTMLEDLRAAATAEEMFQILCNAERDMLKTM